MLALNQTLTVEQRLEKGVMAIMAHPKYVALSNVLLLGERIVSDTAPTAYTNGRDETYGREFVEGLTDAELRFLILHECYHKMYKHLITWKHLWKKHPRYTNMSCDYVINIQLVDGDDGEGFITMPEIGLLDAAYRDMDSIQVFDILYKKDPEGGTGTGGTGDGESLDDHDWEGAEELTQEETDELEREIDEGIRQGILVAGKLGSGGARELEGLLKPQVDWRAVLRDFISTVCSGNDFSTWARPNRKFISAGVYMPSGVSQTVDELVLAIDTSGSIGQEELTTFLSEVTSICTTVKPKQVRLIYWDTEVVHVEKYKDAEIASIATSTKPEGGGGTCVDCVSEYLNDNGIAPEAVIVFTDGYLYGGWSKWNCPVLWTIMDNRKATPNCGKVVHIDSNRI